MQYTYTTGGNIGTLSYREKNDTATRTYTYEYATNTKKLYTILQYQPSQFTVDGKTRKTTTDLVSTYTNKFGSSGTPVSEFTYTYNTWGNITGIKDRSGRQKTCTYNEYGEVTKATEAYANAAATTYTYTYDPVWKDKLTAYDGKAITYDR